VIDPRPALMALLALAVGGAACSRPAATAGGTDTASASSQAQRPAAVAAHAATAAPALATPTGTEAVTGTVAETFDAGTYTYVRVTTETGEIWAAASRFDVAVGQRVTVPLEMPMENFHSKSLNRDFPLIYFASEIAREGKAAPVAQAASAPQLPPGAHPPARDVEAITEVIPQPAGATSVGSVWSTRQALAGKTVSVRGKVVKVNTGIMGRNWLHLQDGTGKASDRTNDLTVTSQDEARVGDIVTATGTIAVDKDFGAGYAYPVILESAKLAR